MVGRDTAAMPRCSSSTSESSWLFVTVPYGKFVHGFYGPIFVKYALEASTSGTLVPRAVA